MGNKIEVLIAQGLNAPNNFKDIPNFVKNVPNFINDVPNFIKDVPRLPKSVLKWGTTFNHFLRVSK